MVVRQKERRSIGRILFVGRDQSLAHFYVKTYAIVKTHANVKEHVSQWTCLFIAHKAQCTCSRRVNDRWSGLILFASVVAKWRRYRHQQHGEQLALYTVSILVKKVQCKCNDTYYVCTFFRCHIYSLQRGCPRKVFSLLLNSGDIRLSAVCWQLQHLRQLLVLWALIVQFDATVSRTGATNQMTQKQPKKKCCQRNVYWSSQAN